MLKHVMIRSTRVKWPLTKAVFHNFFAIQIYKDMSFAGDCTSHAAYTM